jgi:hypothetical protein
LKLEIKKITVTKKIIIMKTIKSLLILLFFGTTTAHAQEASVKSETNVISMRIKLRIISKGAEDANELTFTAQTKAEEKAWKEQKSTKRS